MTEAEDKKDRVISVRISDKLKATLDKMREEHFAEMQASTFLAYLIKIGLEEEETRFEEDRIRKETRLKHAALEEFAGNAGKQPESIDDLSRER
jgi:hypothetical protein